MIAFGMYFIRIMASMYAYYCVKSSIAEYMFKRDMNKYNERKLRRIKGINEFDASMRDCNWTF